MPSPNFSTGTASGNFSHTEGGFSGAGNPASVKVALFAPPSPTNGPPVPFIYSNSAGTFKLSAGSGPGAASYEWQGQHNNDTLTFLAFGSVVDSSGIGVAAGSSVDVWLYQASDAVGNVWYLLFGVGPLPLLPQQRYPLYFSWLDPRAGGNVQRWLTSSGTSRV